MQRSYTAGGVTTIESYLYSFSGGDLSGVLLRRSTDGGSAWTNVRQATYSYYDGTNGNGPAAAGGRVQGSGQRDGQASLGRRRRFFEKSVERRPKGQAGRLHHNGRR